MSTVFVTGIGTDIGKTYVTAGLIRALRSTGRPVSALKPVASGFDPAQPEASDAGALLAALGDGRVEEISPWRFRAPLSPDMAAAREGRQIDFSELVALCRRPSATVRLIEGVGGVMVPLDNRHTVLDWMAAVGAPVLLVAGSYLGAISHTLTAFEAVIQRSLSVLALVVNESPAGVDLCETAATLSRFVAAPIHVVQRQAGASAFAPIAALIKDI
jgi:dethiobiotin synthetase